MIRDDATQAQVDAADPHASTWLSANAGSGKTRVLTDRVARLLLANTNPQNILCLTYTKAAASEMQNRLFKRLGEWAMMPDATLRQQLRDLGVQGDGPQLDLGDARKLFAAAIEAPGGLKIQTIHSFCAGILRRFPLEANVSPQFRELEDHETDLLRKEVLEAMSRDADRDRVDALAKYYTGDEIGRLLNEITGKKDDFHAASADAIVAALGTTLTAKPSDAIGVVFNGSEQRIAQDVAQAFTDQGNSYQKFAKDLNALSLTNPGLADMEAVFGLLLYADKTSKSRNYPQSNHTKAVNAIAHCIDPLHAWMDRAEEGWQYWLRIAQRDRSLALLEFANAFNARYEALKAKRGVMDFDDLITKTKTLLSDSNMAQWVLFRLDGGVDHILVDEAQDTSPTQWKVVELLTQEFTAGEGAHAEKPRTIFVVGDKKQSIYSFQGADPEGFDRMSAHFGSALESVDSELKQRELLFSFRSSQAILRLVDAVFQGPRLVGLGDHMRHEAFNTEMPGRVDLWPVVEKADEIKGAWDDPLDLKGETHHTKRLATNIANEIHRMMQEEWISAKIDGDWVRRPVTEGDVLILVRRRRELFSAIISACKKLGLKVAGADRMILGNELAVKDIMALLQFLALPEDDLSLAAALKSPLFGWSERDLFRLARARPAGMTLWEALRKQGKTYHDTHERLQDLRDSTDFLRPYDLINKILIQQDGRRRLVRQLGVEAEDGIDALLAQALTYEHGSVPSLTGFLAWFEGEEITVKRQMESAGDRIRIMTVHGAKGLEAPIVILPDCGKIKRDLKTEVLVADSPPIWKTTGPETPRSTALIENALKDAQDRERRRLLYVAMTRAESWLIVAASGDIGKEDESWYNMVHDTMNHLDCIEVETAVGTTLRSEVGDWGKYPKTGMNRVETYGDTEVAFSDDPVSSPTAAKTVAPSALKGAKVLPGETEADSEDTALAYGRIIHTLLEILPSIPQKDRANYADQFLDTHPDAQFVPNRSDVIKQAMTVLTAPHLSDLFADGLTEVDITANIPELDGARIHGAIDRLIVRPEDVLAIDYKSNRLIPTTPKDIPLGLTRQMAVYQRALQQVYPHKRVRTALLWTRSAQLMELPDQMLTEALIDVTAP